MKSDSILTNSGANSDAVLSIIKPALDSNGIVSLEQVEKMLEEANFDLQSVGMNSVKDLLDQLEDEFEMLTTDDGVKVKCLNVNVSKKIPETQKMTNKSTQTEDFNSSNKKIGLAINQLLKDMPDPDGKVSLPQLGIELSNQKVKLPNGEKLSAYLRRYPSIFEVWTNGVETYVRNVAERSAGESTSPKTNNSQTMRKGFVSLYNIFDFAYFKDYNIVKKELGSIASQDGWFVLPDPQEKDPYLLLDYKFRTNFAILINSQLSSGGDYFIMQPDKAEFNTGFTTVDGKRIRAHFKLNQQRDPARWQNWIFDHFSIEEVE